ncbi:cysteine--tRNA ligase [Candidatus Woesearchaeota archaeon]|nr:cysteine--tRNA ligase [Candidatus Woesearchaeota archaeon]
MTLQIYNTLTRKKQEFKPVTKGVAKIYTCGPTVYNYAHIGNWRSFIFSDLLRRYLKFKGYEIEHVMNITDVDDKTIRDSKKEGISLQEFTKRYTKYFMEDMDALNIQRVDHYPKATETIPEMTNLVKCLMDKDFAYKSDDGSVYYDVSKFKEYGKLSKIKFENLKAGARVKQDEYEKDSANDFALWKGYEEKDGDVFWETDIGKGRPGWHIECSAMSMKFLGETFDIHTGGVDLVFPHHENEIAQSEACTGKNFVNYWMHCAHLIVEGEKMSKSKGNFYILKDILDKGYSPKAVRYLLMSTHYRQKLNFTFEGLDSAEQNIAKFKEFLRNLKAVKSEKDNPEISDKIKKSKQDFENTMDHDLNISRGLAVIFEFMKDINKLISEDKISRQDALQAYNLMMEFDKVLGIMEFKEQKIPEEIKELAEKREKARQEKDWETADKLRDEIKEKGYEIEDKGDAYIIKKT